MTIRFVTYAAIFALSAATAVAAHAASTSDPSQDRAENAITAQLNQQQLEGQGGYAIETYQGIMHSPNGDTMHEQIAQPPSDDGNLSIIE
jgi:opacity protein-like surface antigen